jgi:enoyl-CoA hydratase/carnithine racemase
MEEQAVVVERRGGVLIAKLNRPERRNAINRALCDQLTSAAHAIDRDPGLRVGILASSTPGMFCAGADLQALARGELVQFDGSPLVSFSSLARLKPWIAACTGPVLGGGLEHALACEMIVAGEGATFGLPEVKRGLLAAGGGVFRLRRAIPRAVALEMLLTGATISAARAYEIGLINRVVPDTQVVDAALEIAGQIEAAAPGAVSEALRLANLATDLPESELWTPTREAMDRLKGHPDFKEGVAAFMEKRKPVWTG